MMTDIHWLMKLYHFIKQTSLFTIKVGITNYNKALY